MEELDRDKSCVSKREVVGGGGGVGGGETGVRGTIGVIVSADVESRGQGGTER